MFPSRRSHIRDAGNSRLQRLDDYPAGGYSLVTPEVGLPARSEPRKEQLRSVVMATKTLGPDVLWKWEDSLDGALRQKLMSAVESTWGFAHMTAWSYLNDGAQGPELIEQALEKVQVFALRTSPPPSTQKLTARLKSQIRRLAKQRKNRNKEVQDGSALGLELYPASQVPDPTEVLFLQEIVREYSPQAKEIAQYIRLGYTWRDIGEALGIDHSSIRKSFRRETDAVLIKLGRGVPVER